MSADVVSSRAREDCRLEAQYGHQQNVEMIPLMMETGYRPTGWLGLIMGTRLYFNFHPAAVETDEMFTQQVDLVQRDLGDRGKVGRASEEREDVPPAALATHAWQAEPEPALAAVCSRFRAPTPVPALSRASAPATPAAPNSFTPSMQTSSPALAIQPWSSDDASLVDVLLKREDKIRQEAKAEKAEMGAKMEAKLQKMREEMAPKEAVPEAQIAALQARLAALHDAQLLSDEELFSVEDAIADFVELTSLMGVITREVAHTSAVVGKLIKLVALSGRIAADGAFARQLRRKHV